MENTTILSTVSFAKYKSKIGLILYSNEDMDIVNLFTGHKHLEVNRNDTTSLTPEEITEELSRNAELKQLAYENDLIEIHSQDTFTSYLNYASKYN